MGYGWISIHRQIQQHWLWEDKPFSKGQAWIDLLILANHEDSKFLLGNQLIEVQQGEVITSEVKLMDRWGWSKTKVRAFLELLQNDSMIVKKADSKKTSLSIVNYSTFQNVQTTKELIKNRKATAKELEKDTINNDNNSNNDNKSIYTQDELKILEFWNSKEIVKHKQTEELEKCIYYALKKYSKENILISITNYFIVYSDKSYFYNHIWTLGKFLKQSNGLPEFLEDGQAWINYKSREVKNNESLTGNGRKFESNSQYAKAFDGDI